MPGESGNLSIYLENGSSEINRLIEWSLTAENSVNSAETSAIGQVQISRSLPANSIDSSSDQLLGGSSNSSSLLVLVIGLLIVITIAGALFYRNSQSVGQDDFGDSLAEDYTSQSIEPASSESIEAMMHYENQQPSPAISAPSADQNPTSVDGSGYEWYSSGELHWYRNEGSDGEWFPFKQ
jgi:hypothetical protein